MIQQRLISDKKTQNPTSRDLDLYLNASFSSLFMVSMSGSSTRKVAQSWQNSPNSISPDPSSSISSSRSFNSSSVGRKPIALMISPRSSAERNSCLLVSNRSKQTWSKKYKGVQVILSLQRQHVQVRFVAMKINLPWDTWSHRGRGWSPRSPPQSQCQHTGLLAPFFFCKPTKSALTHLFGIKYLQHVTIRLVDLNCRYFRLYEVKIWTRSNFNCAWLVILALYHFIIDS